MNKILLILAITILSVAGLAHHKKILIGYWCPSGCFWVPNPWTGEMVVKDRNGGPVFPRYRVIQHKIKTWT